MRFQTSARTPRLMAAVAAAAVIGSLLSVAPTEQSPAEASDIATGTTYYVDADGGQDAADGLAPESAWQSLDRVNETTFEPGDRILLQAGDSWTGQLWPKGSGTSEAPITVASYGSGAKPAVRGEGAVDDAVRLFNQSHWVISDLDVSNERTGGATAADNLADLRGIHVSGDNSTTLTGFSIIGVDVHDVTGEVNWISGSVENNAPGVTFKTGWDGSKKTGGIVFDTTVPDILNPPASPTILNDILVEGSTVVNTSFAGIVVKQYTGDGRDENGDIIATSTGWGTRASATDPKFAPHTDLTIRGNYIRQDGTAYGCNGMYLTNVRGALVEGNVVYRTGTSGIETYYADDVTIQHNEVYETQQKAGGADSNGIDPDKGTTRQVVQYNYLHGNGDGVLICQFAFGDAIVRHNVIVDNKRYPIYLHSDRAATAKIYNNTIVNRVSNYLIYGYGSSLNATYEITDNIIHSTRAHATLTTSPTISYRNNLYSGAALTVPSGDTSALVGDALFVAPDVTGPYGTPDTGPQLATAHGFALQSGSKGVNTGAGVEGAATVDFAGASRPTGAPDVGAFEYASAASATTETVSGFVRDGSGRALSGTAVTVDVGTTLKSGTTDATGWFRIPGVPFGDATVTATRAGYAGEPLSVAVGSGTSALAGVVLSSTSNVGSVSGSVLDVTGAPLPSATVEVRSAGGTVVATGAPGADGRYAIGEVPIGEGYTVVAQAAELRPASIGGIAVDPAADSAVRALLLQPAEPAEVFSDDVEARPAGRLDSVDGYTVSHAGGSVDVVDVAGTRALKLTRTINSGSTSVQRNHAAPLTGLVTIDADVMRNDATDGVANWFSVPYLYGTNGAVNVSVAFSRGQIVAYQGTQSTNLMRYEQGRWYHLTLEVDTVNQRFDLLVDDVRLLDDATFRNPMPGGIARIEYYANSSNRGAVHVDDLRILQGTERDRGNAELSAVTTDAGPATRTDDGWKLDVPAGTESIRVTAIPEAEVVGGLTIDGAAVEPGVASEPISLAEGTNEIVIAVTAENGTERTHRLVVERGLLDADATLRNLEVAGASLEPAFSPDVLEYSVTTAAGTGELVVTPTTSAPQSELAVNGQPATSGAPVTVSVSDGTAIPVTVSSADGTATVTYTVTVHVPDPAAPAKAKLSNTSGWAHGLHDGRFVVQLDLWWGQTAREFRLFENGTLIATVPLEIAGVGEQHAKVEIDGRPNGEYVYTGELVNNVGTTATSSTTVKVTDAAPGVPSLRASGTGTTRTLITDLWWGTNATSYRLYRNGELIDERELDAATPSPQHVETVVETLAPGRHEFRSVLANAYGETSSRPFVVTVR